MCDSCKFRYFFLLEADAAPQCKPKNSWGAAGILVTNLQANRFKSGVKLDACLHDRWPRFGKE